MFDLYVDGNWNGTYPLEKILSVAKHFLQFGCNIEIKQDDEMPSIQPYMFNQQSINTNFPYEVTH